MSVKSEQAIAVDFTTNSSTGAATDADALPVGTLVVDGVDNAAVVTVTNKGTGNYKAEVTLPAELTAGARVQIRIAATVGGVAAKAIIWEDFVDPKRVGDLNDLTAQQVADAAKLAPSPGDADIGSLKYQVDACVSQASSAASYSELVNSRLPASPAAVGSAMTLADGAITASKIATDAISADKIAADAVTKLQAGLSTLTAQQVADAAKLAPSAGDADPGSLKAQVDTCVAQASNAAAYSELVHARLPANPAAVGSEMTLAADQAVNVTKVAGSAVTGVDDFKADVSGLALESTLTAMKGAGWTDETLKKISDGVASNASYIASLHDFNPATETVTVGTNNDKTGYSLSTAGVQAIWDFAVASIAAAGSIGKRIVDYLTGDIYARLGAPAGSSIAADIATRATPAQVNAECAAALADYDPPTKAEMDAGLAGITVSLSSSDIESIASLIQVDPQLVRDALAIDLTAGRTPTSGSIDKFLELIKNSTDRLAAGGITFQNAVDARGNMKLYAGQTYAGGTIVSVGRTGWTGPNLNGLAGTMVVQTLANYKKNTRIPDHEFPGVTFVQVGNDVTANVELTDEDSSLLWPANGKPEFWYQILYRAGGTTYVVAEGPMLTKKVIESSES